MIKYLSKIAMPLLFAAGCTSAEYGDSPPIQWGYNALETGAAVKPSTQEADLRNRLYINADANIGPMQAGYHGFNEVDNFNAKDYYFGRQVFTFGERDAKIKAVLAIRTNTDEIQDIKTGIRDTYINELVGSYGFTDLIVDKNEVNLATLYGWGLGKGFSFELYNSTDIPFHSRVGQYNELQVKKDLTDNFTLFGRMEIPKFKTEEAAYVAGLTVKF